MFNPESFVAECLAAVRADRTHRGVLDLMQRALADPGAVRAAFGAAQMGVLTPLYRSDELTVLNVIWKPGMSVPPHNHNMWAVIGVYDGREDNIFWKRLQGGRVTAAGAQSLCAGDVVPLGRDIIHSVHNPVARSSAAIHVYGGDFFADGRSEWDAEALTEHAYDLSVARARFG
ncbi:MAG: hypothetical protein ACRCUI_04680 [Polymorphobacter sp.]